MTSSNICTHTLVAGFDGTHGGISLEIDFWLRREWTSIREWSLFRGGEGNGGGEQRGREGRRQEEMETGNSGERGTEENKGEGEEGVMATVVETSDLDCNIP